MRSAAGEGTYKKKKDISSMKYMAEFRNKQDEEFTIFSMEDYDATPTDIEAFACVLGDKPVCQYITDEAVEKYNHPNIESLTIDILRNSALRWTEDKEKRFLVRDYAGRPVGMIGVTLKDLRTGELWYYKTSAVGAFMYEALVLAIGFLKQEGIKNLSASIEPDNLRSKKILSKLGFKFKNIEESAPKNMIMDLK